MDSIDDCINKDYKIFNNDCYKKGCPQNTKLNTDNHSCICSFYYYNSIDTNNLTCFDENEKCENNNYLYSNPDTLECFETLKECFLKNNLFYFNYNCYKGDCPAGKILLEMIVNDTIRNEITSIVNNKESLDNLCVCNNILSANYLIRENNYNGTQICIDDPMDIYEEKCIIGEYPIEFNLNPDSCPVIYHNNCATYVIDDKCISQKNPNLVCLVEIKLDMKIFNFICFEKFLQIEKNIQNISYKNIPISTSPGISIYSYYNQSSINEILKKYSNISILYLNDCEDKIRQKYNLDKDEKIFILGIDSPYKFKKSPTNVYNFEIILENGTQVEDLSICKDTNLTLSSPIINEKLIHYEEAVYFASFGYDIYNKHDKFYTSYCAPASINNNDITLTDRYKDFYISNESFCNDSCIYNYVNLTSKRILCNCKPNYSHKTEKSNEEQSYSNYILSLINYKIIVCYKLLFNIKNYYYNCGFFVGVGVFIFCLVECVVFMKLGLNLMNKYLIGNIPINLNQKENKKIERIDTIKNNKNKSHRSLKKVKRVIYKSTNKETSSLFNNKNNKISIDMNKVNYEDLNNNDLVSNPPKNINIFKINNNNNHSLNNNIINESEKSENHEFKTRKRNYSVKIKRKKKKLYKKNIIILSSNKDEKKNSSHLEGGEKSNLNILKMSNNINNNSINIINKEYFFIDPLINFNNYIIINDNSIDKKEINNVPYTQALRIDKRQFWDMYLSVVYNEINAISIFYYKNEYVHISLTTSIYVFSELLDFTINCFIYSDDEVSEKYHNNGSLTILTSLTLSFLSNIFSNIIVYLICRLTNFSEILEIYIKDMKIPGFYEKNILRIVKYAKIKLVIFYFIEFTVIICLVYYLFIFCTVFHNTQISVILNYFYGIIESFAISLILAFITTSCRFISIKFKISRLYNISKYCYQHF